MVMKQLPVYPIPCRIASGTPAEVFCRYYKSGKMGIFESLHA